LRFDYETVNNMDQKQLAAPKRPILGHEQLGSPRKLQAKVSPLALPVYKRQEQKQPAAPKRPILGHEQPRSQRELQAKLNPLALPVYKHQDQKQLAAPKRPILGHEQLGSQRELQRKLNPLALSVYKSQLTSTVHQKKEAPGNGYLNSTNHGPAKPAIHWSRLPLKALRQKVEIATSQPKPTVNKPSNGAQSRLSHGSRSISGTVQSKTAPRAGARPQVSTAVAQRRVSVIQRNIFGDAANWLSEGISSLLGSILFPYVEDDDGNPIYLGSHEIYNIEDREEEEFKRTRPVEYKQSRWDTTMRNWDTNSMPTAYSFASTKGNKAWQYTATLQWVVPGRLLKPEKVRAHVHYYVDIERAWRRGGSDTLKVRKVKGHFWISDLDNMSGQTPQNVVNNAPALPDGWDQHYLDYVDVRTTTYLTNAHSNGNWN
jgi:hypothetical protein